MDHEEWRDIPGWEGLYQASNYGQIKSCRRSKLMTINYSKLGYGRISMRKGGRLYTKNIHRLIIQAFLGEKPGYEVNHKDLNKANNRIENLEYVTRSQNMKHAYEMGARSLTVFNRISRQVAGTNHYNTGIENPRSKLTENEVAIIKKLLTHQYCNQAEIARTFNVSRSTIRDINNGKRWKMIGDYNYPIVKKIKNVA